MGKGPWLSERTSALLADLKDEVVGDGKDLCLIPCNATAILSRQYWLWNTNSLTQYKANVYGFSSIFIENLYIWRIGLGPEHFKVKLLT